MYFLLGAMGGVGGVIVRIHVGGWFGRKLGVLEMEDDDDEGDQGYIGPVIADLYI